MTRNALDDALLAANRTLFRRFAVPIGILVVGILLVGLQSINNGDVLDKVEATGKDAAVVADFVRDCLQHPDLLTPEERTARCGGTGDDGAARAVKVIIESNFCALKILPQNRTDENMAKCANDALRGLNE